MNRPHPTATDLAIARERFHAESKPGIVHTGRYRLRYYDWGNPYSPAIISVHGLCDQPLSFCMLDSQLVDRGHRVISYDLPNGKDDDARLGRYRHDHMVDDLLALADHLQLPAVNVLGTSFGSTITLRALARNPERFHRAVLQGGFAHRPIIHIERGLSHLGRYWPWRMGDLPIRQKVMEKLEAPQFEGCPPEIYSFLNECSGQTPIRAAARRALILAELDLRPQLPSIPHPLLMIGGDRDTIVPRWCEAEVEKGVPDVRRIELRPCGHYPQYTMPARMAEEMDRFLRA